MKKKLVRMTTVPQSMTGLLKGQLSFMSQHFEVIGISGSEDGVLEKIGEKENIRVIPAEMTRTISPLKDIVAVYKIYKIFTRERPYIVHTHTPKAGTLGMIAAYFAKVPVRLHTVAGLPLLEAKGIKRLILNLVESLTYKFATKVYPNSFGLRNIILKSGFTTEKKIKVLGNGSSNGIDTFFFDPRSIKEDKINKLKTELTIEENDYVYIYIGRLVKDKGINELVEAFNRLNSKYQNIKLLLVGSFERNLDPLETKTENNIKVSSNIIFAGHNPDVRHFLAISDVLTFPSYREGFPNVVMEAGAMGLPSIVTNINGCNEIIIHNQNGLIIPSKSTDELFKAMDYCYQNRQNEVFDRQLIRQMIVDRYDRKNMWNYILNEYRTFLIKN